jgi:signal transduction histidine kinase
VRPLLPNKSLRVRLLAGAAAAILVALTASWFVMTLLFQRHIERRVEGELTRDARQLVAGLTLDADGRPVIDRAPTDSRFDEPRGGLYWALSTQRQQLKSHSLWDENLPPSPTANAAAWSTRIADGPFDQRVLLIERWVQPHSEGARVLVQVALDYATVRDARREFGSDLAFYLLLLWMILSGAAWAQVELGLRPLSRVRRELETLKSSPANRLQEGYPVEIQPLTHAINELAEAREKDLAAARRRAADLAHGLKTPLAALAAGSRRVRDRGADYDADGLDRAIAAATAAVNAELARSRAASIRHATHEIRTPAQPVVEQVVSVVERTDFGAQRVFEVNIPEDLVVPVAAEDLTELLGAVIENAARFSRRLVNVSGMKRDATATLVIEDDGPGLSPSRAEQVLSRRGRLDEAGGNTGLGLSIARDLIEATRGQLTLGAATRGGLRVQMDWHCSNPDSRPVEHRSRHT